jgi:hypothetical protein
MLASQPDDTIDASDIPELADAHWSGAERGRFHRPIKPKEPPAWMRAFWPG